MKIYPDALYKVKIYYQDCTHKIAVIKGETVLAAYNIGFPIDVIRKIKKQNITPTAPDQCPPCADSDKGSTERGTGG